MSSSCHSQPLQDKQDVHAHPAYINVCTQQQDELNLLMLKNGSPLNRSAITDSLDRFFEIRPQESQKDEGVRAGNRESKEPEVSSESSPSDSPLTQTSTSDTSAKEGKIAPCVHPESHDNAPQQAYGFSSREHLTVADPRDAGLEQPHTTLHMALKTSTSDDTSKSEQPSKLAPVKIDYPRNCIFQESRKPQPSLVKRPMPLSEQRKPAERTSPLIHTYSAQSLKATSAPQARFNVQDHNKPLIQLPPGPPLSEPQIQPINAVHHLQTTPTRTSTLTPISGRERRDLLATSPKSNITPDVHTQCDDTQKQNSVLTPLACVPRPPTQPPPPNYTSCVSARRRRFVKTQSSGPLLHETC